ELADRRLARHRGAEGHSRGSAEDAHQRAEARLRLEGIQGLHGEPRLRHSVGRRRRHDEVHGGLRRESRRGAESRRARQIKIHDGLTGAALVVLAGIILWHIQGFPAMPGQKFGPAWFPGLIAVGLGICGLLLMRVGWRSAQPWFTWPGWTLHKRAVAGV